MAEMQRMEFGYCVPSGERGAETIRRNQFTADMHAMLDVAAQGFDSIWVSDHLMFNGRYRLESWTQATWIAARYPNVRLGHMVLCNSFRNPALMAKMAATLQTLSGGRFILAYGAGWHEPEYKGYGFDFATGPVRVAMLDEALQIIRTLWTQDGPVDFAGEHYQLEGAYCVPKPDPLPLIMVGGGGEKLTLRVVARYGDWWNDVYRRPAVLQRKLDALRVHCAAENRDYEALRKTLMVWVYLDKSHARAVERAAAVDPDNESVIAGDPAAIRDRFEELVALGFDMSMVVLPGFPETTDLRLFLDEVVPHFA